MKIFVPYERLIHSYLVYSPHVSSFHNRLFGFNEDAFGFRYN